MALKWAKKLLLAKAEAQAGTAQTLAKEDAILVSNVELNQLAGDSVSRELERSYFGNSDQIPVNTHLSLTFRVELAGSGAKAKPPGWGKLLLPCGMKETINVNKSVIYAPISGGEPTITLGLNIDGQLHTLAGSRGSFGIEEGANAIPYLTFSFIGLYTEPISAAPVKSPNFTAFKKPLIGSNKNTPAFSFYGASPALSSFSYDHANEVVHREVIGAKNSVVISNRAPTASITIDAPAYGTLNLVKKAKDGTPGALSIQHGVGEGGQVTISMPQTAISGISNTEADGIWQNEVSLAVLPNAGNDEVEITTS